ncbi:MAG: hypothetical protein LBD38_01245 [Streptococcaceae bacterium]|jgi:vacuolar-type H+-ATPase subunit E/Vma4|nr:hypothetical protein [Streptococcaceae bacterium]
MSSLEKMMQEILDEAHQEISETVEKDFLIKKESLEKSFAQKVKELEKEFALKERALNVSTEKSIEAMKLSSGREILVEKQKQLKVNLKKAEQEFEKISTADFLDLVKKSVKKTEFQNGVIQLGAYSEKHIQELPESLQNRGIVLSKEFVPETYGFLLQNETVEYNFTTAAIFREIEEKHAFELSKVLFPE